MDLRWGKRKVMRHVREYKGQDRISSLPDDVLHLILKFLPDTKSAVRTSILSKRWKLIWTTLPFLKFECPLRASSKVSTNLARHVLKHRDHDSSVSHLAIANLPPVRISNSPEENKSNAYFGNEGPFTFPTPPALSDKYIDYAVSHNVQVFNVHLRKEHEAIMLRRCSSNSITKLVLIMKVWDIVDESYCWNLPALRELHLELTRGGDGNLVLSVKCLTCLPLLRSLSLTVWDFRVWNSRQPDWCLDLPELTSLCLTVCYMPRKFWNLPALKTLTLDQVHFPGNLSDALAALVSLQNLTLHLMSLQGCQIRCPQLINLEIETLCCDTIEGNIVVVAPKLTDFTSVGIFPITFGDSKLDNVYVNLRGWIDGKKFTKKTLKGFYQGFIVMLPGLRSAKILNLQLETIEALSSISGFLASSPSPFYNLKYVKLPHGFEEASLSSIVKTYLLGGSPTATIVATLPQNIVPHATTASMIARN